MKNGSSSLTTPTNVRGCAGDEIPYNFVKGEIHEKKVILSVWWEVPSELLPDNTTVTTEVYCAQLRRLADKIRKEHPKLNNVGLLHVNARPHIAKNFLENPGARMGSSTAPTVQPGPGSKRPPLPIASASPRREALR